MPQFKIKLPGKLARVEIIRSGEAHYDMAVFAPIEITKTKNGLITKEVQEEELKKKSRTFFYEEKSLTSSDFIQIDLTKVLNSAISVEDVQDEIQHAYDRGFDEAQQLTRTTFEIELQKRQHWILNFDTVFKQMQAQFSSELRKLEESVVPLAAMIAEHILEKEVSADSNIVVEQVRKAIRNLDNENILKIHLHPYNIEILKSVGSALVPDQSKLEHMSLVANEELDQGSCVIETTAGIIDASFKSQLEKLKQKLLNAQHIHKEELNDMPSFEEADDL